MNKQEAIKRIESNALNIGDNDLVVALNVAKHIINQINEPQKVTIPKFVAEWIEYCKSNKLTLLGAFDPVSEHGIGLADTFTGVVLKGIDWAKRNQETFSRAWLDGYTVEKEKLYTVKIADAVLTKITIWREQNVKYKYSMVPLKDVFKVFDDGIYSNFLTETEIKQADERLWQFAKEVE